MGGEARAIVQAGEKGRVGVAAAAWHCNHCCRGVAAAAWHCDQLLEGRWSLQMLHQDLQVRPLDVLPQPLRRCLSVGADSPARQRQCGGGEGRQRRRPNLIVGVGFLIA